MVKYIGLFLIFILLLAGCKDNSPILNTEFVDVHIFNELKADYDELIEQVAIQGGEINQLKLDYMKIEDSDITIKITELENKIRNLEAQLYEESQKNLMNNINAMRSYNYMLLKGDVDIVMGYLQEIDLTESKIIVDEIEWINLSDTDRMIELGLTDEELPSGYYIYDLDEDMDEYYISKLASHYTFNGSSLEMSSLDKLQEELVEQNGKLFQLFIVDDEVIDITEVYRP